MKHLFIINPEAGKGTTLDLIPEIKKAFYNKKDEYFIEVTERPGHAAEIVSSYVSREKYRVYSLGGDGTLNEILNGMVGSDSSLAVIPCGTGNDFIRNISDKNDFSNIIGKSIRGKEKWVDLGRVNDSYFINIASIGFDAEVASNSIRFKKIPVLNGSVAYILGILYTVFTYKSKKLEMTIDDKSIKTHPLLVTLANGKYYGGGMKPSPNSIIDDGILDICLIEDLSMLRLLNLFPQFIKGNHGKYKEVSFHKAKKIKVTSKEMLSVSFDGEVKQISDIDIEIIHKGIRIVIPV